MECNICGKIMKNYSCFKQHKESCERLNKIKDEVIDLYHNQKLSIRDLVKRFGISKTPLLKILGDTTRNYSESTKLNRKKYPEKFKHTEQSKSKLRDARLKFMKENPDKTAWRKKNLSYPEKLFLDKITELGWDKKYCIEREFSFFPYFIDFAFLNEKIAVEIDGSQHLMEERKILDEKKDKLLIDSGWKVIRITENEVKINLNETLLKVENIVNSNEKINFFSFGIFKKKKKESEKIKGFLTKKEIQRTLNQRKMERPSKKILENQIKEYGFSKTGRIYGVSDNAIRKWVKFYEKYPIPESDRGLILERNS
jgi:very-short-patch-repair endonuclease/transposase-like protein